MSAITEEKQSARTEPCISFSGALPEVGYDPELILDKLKSSKHGNADWREGRTWSLVYHKDAEHEKFLKEAYASHFSENYLNPMAFSNLRQFEYEVVRMCARLFCGDDAVVGTVTSGGTESILLAVKSYRDRARDQRRKRSRLNMIVPDSVHVAFDKAAHYFDVDLIRVPLGDDMRVDTLAVEKLINRNTILLVGSAPNYPFGTVDDISALSRLALKHNLPLHVDACVGGFMLPFLAEIGYGQAAFDFSLPGVTSISADLHKYGYAAKGASVILYRNMNYLKYQFIICSDWCGGVYASPTLLGTRSGGAIAAAWGALNSIGQQGYRELARNTWEVTRQLIEGINGIEGLQVIGEPAMTIFAYQSTDENLDIFVVGDLMEERGWHMDRQQKPNSLHAMVTINHQSHYQNYLKDLQASVRIARSQPERSRQGGAAMYGMVAKVPLRGVVRNNVLKMMETLYGTAPDALGSGIDGIGQQSKMALGARILWAADWIGKAFRKLANRIKTR